MRMKKLIFGVIFAAVVGTVVSGGSANVTANEPEQIRRVEYYGRDEYGNTYWCSFGSSAGTFCYSCSPEGPCQ